MQVINSSIQSRYGEETEETEVYIVYLKEEDKMGRYEVKVIWGNVL